MTIAPIVVTYNNVSTIERVLEALFSQQLGGHTLDVVVVDKGSSDGTVDLVRDREGVTFVDLPIPRTGPGIGFNQGVHATPGEVIMLLTGDMVLQSEDVLKRAADRVAAEPHTVFGGRILTSEGGIQHSKGSWPTLTGVISYRLRCCEGRAMHHWSGYESDQPVDWVCGGFAFFSRELWDEIGGYDTDYFLYFEDLDFCRRAANLGAPSKYIADLVALHDHPAEERKSRKGHWLDSYVLYCRKHHAPLSPTRLAATLWRALHGGG